MEKMVLFCPYCVTKQVFSNSVCSTCNREIPKDYIEAAKTNPPLWIVAFGYPQHGKTSAIHAMCLAIENIDKVASKAYFEYLDRRTADEMAHVRKAYTIGQVNSPTTQNILTPEPLLISLTGFPTEENNSFVIYDLPGEAATNPESRLARSLVNARAVWFIISLPDLAKIETHDDNPARTVVDLFSTYRAILDILRIPITNINIIVNYTKADTFRYWDPNELPSNIIDYLAQDPYYDLADSKSRVSEDFDLGSYLSTLEGVSKELRQYTIDHVPQGLSFINLLENKYGVNLKFCITSATGGGGSSSQSSLGVRIQHYRVLDPLLWLVHFNQTLPSVGTKRVFISYKRTDWDTFVNPLINRLKSENIDFWVDQHLIAGSDDWLDKINQALRECDTMILCVTPEALESRHVKLEYRYFFNNNKTLVPLICRDTELPAELQTIQYLNYSEIDKLVALLK